MIFIPFLYFLTIFICVFYRRRRLDIATYTILLYTIISFFGILVDCLGLRYPDQIGYKISFDATLAYCFLLTLFWIPILLFTQKRIAIFCPVENDTLFKAVSVVSFLFFVVTLVGSFNSVVQVLMGDMAALRMAFYAGDVENAWFASFPIWLRFPIVLGNMLFGCFWILQFMSFFSLFIQKTKVKYSIFFLLASLLGPLWGVLAIDRSKVTYWIISLFANYILFSEYMNKKEKKVLKFIGMILIALLIVYLSMMTNARFEMRYYGEGISGAMGGLITYIGQPFVNFAFFFDNFSTSYPTLASIFPFFHKYVLGSFGSGVEIQEFLTETYKMKFGVFFTFLGQILISAGKIGMVLYVLGLSFIGTVFFKSTAIQLNSILKMYLFMAYSSVMFLGLFGHYYANAICTFSLFAFAVVFKLLMTRNK